jgi:hypothetical protein
VATATEELKRTRRALADVQGSLLTLVGAGGQAGCRAEMVLT